MARLTRTAQFRLTPEDYATLQELARRSGVRPSTMVRKLIRTVGELTPAAKSEAPTAGTR